MKRKPRSERRLVNGFPVLIWIVSYKSGSEESKIGEEVLSRISDEAGVKILPGQLPLTISINSTICRMVEIAEGDSSTYLISVFLNQKDHKRRTAFYDLNKLPPLVCRFLDAFPKNPISTFIISVGCPRKPEESFKDLEKYSRLHNKQVTSAGVIRNHLLATLETGSENYNRDVRRMLLIPPDNPIGRKVSEVESLVKDFARYASLTGRLNNLFQERSIIFKQVESSEKNTQERIQDMLGRIRRPPEQVKPGDLGSMLTEMNSIFSRLTTITSSMRRDQVRARGYLQRVRGIFNMWNEKPVKTYPTHTSVEINNLERIVNSFKDSVDRLQALRTQLDTVLDTIRTYVGIQQQNISIEEQRNTKKLLSRMVNLQEVLHKLEILVVAFYITEMGRLVFETIAHDLADVLTITFIPAALILAIGIKRFLHKHE